MFEAVIAVAFTAAATAVIRHVRIESKSKQYFEDSLS